MNNDAEYLMHMTAAEKAAYNRKYYQRNKQYWVDYYKTGHGIGRNGGDSHTVGRSAGGGGSHWEPAKRTPSGGGSHWEPAKRTGGGYHYGNENTLNDLYKDFPMGSKKSNSAQPQPKKKKGLSNLYDKGVNRTRTANVPTKTESGSAINAPVYKGKQGHWNENAERVTSATRSFLSNLKNTIANAAKGATQTVARSAENGRKYASSMFSSVKATVGDIKREANELISRAKKTLDEVMSGEIQFQGESGTRHNIVTGKSFYYDTLKGIVQPISDSEALRLVINGEEPRPWTLQDYQNEKKRRKAKKY